MLALVDYREDKDFIDPHLVVDVVFKLAYTCFADTTFDNRGRQWVESEILKLFQSPGYEIMAEVGLLFFEKSLGAPKVG
jgi:hypothetical protein